jgi:hypothetical protein
LFEEDGIETMFAMTGRSLGSVDLFNQPKRGCPFEIEERALSANLLRGRLVNERTRLWFVD